MRAPRAVVIGSGIGGLTTAVALHRSGWQVTVVERSASLEPVGAGISLAPNAQRALDVIGLGDEIRSLAAWQGEGGMRSPDGRWLARTDSTAAPSGSAARSSCCTGPPWSTASPPRSPRPPSGPAARPASWTRAPRAAGPP